MSDGARTAAPAQETYNSSRQAREGLISHGRDIAARCAETLRETHDTCYDVMLT